VPAVDNATPDDHDAPSIPDTAQASGDPAPFNLEDLSRDHDDDAPQDQNDVSAGERAHPADQGGYQS
jgi:hypothetical protein